MTTSSGEATHELLGGETALERLRDVIPSWVDPADAVAAVMCAFTQRLTQGEARHVLTDVPLSVGTLFARCVLHRDERASAFDLPSFLETVAAHLNLSADEAEPVARAVLSVIQSCLSPEVVGHVASQLPAELELLWREVWERQGSPVR